VKVLQLSFGIFVGEEFTVFGFVRDELKKKLGTTGLTVESPLFAANLIRREHNFHIKCFNSLRKPAMHVDSRVKYASEIIRQTNFRHVTNVSLSFEQIGAFKTSSQR